MKLWPILMCLPIAAVATRSAAAAATDQAAMLEAWRSITGAGIARHIAILASDEFEGREPGTAGEQNAVRYMEQAFRDAGAGPGVGGQYLQAVPMVELTRDPAPKFAIAGTKKKQTYELRTDYVASAGGPREHAAFERLPIVFAGHGATAPEYDWDDYASGSVQGCAVILLHGDPECADDSTAFRGKALTLHGLSGTQYENAARHGARAAIVVHTEASTGVPWNLLAGGGGGNTQNFLIDDGTKPRLEMVVHVSEPAARRMLASVGLDLDSLTARSNRRGFTTVRTPLTTSMSYTAKLRSITSHNVIAKIEGSEAKDEAVILTGHWDHIGKNDALPGNDKIFNGAVDNATGSASLIELARAWASLPKKPRRTVYFVATTAEEKGLLGSEFLARNPIVPLDKTIAVMNLDALFPYSAYSAMTVTALGSSELEDVLAEACARIGRILQDDGAPQVGAYYRSDHYPFAKRGVPALFAVGNPRPEEMTESNPVNARFTEYMRNGYHKVGDEYDPKTWDMAGIEGDVRVYFETAWRVADSTKYPNWRYENEFRALRDAMMSSSGTPGGKRAASP